MDRLEYIAPKCLREAAELMRAWKGRAKLLAGGTNLIPDMRSRKIAPEVLIDLSGLRDLSYIRQTERVVSIGALTTICELVSSEVIQQETPMLASAASRLGNSLTRNRATIGGNLADGSPAADLAPPLLAMEASIRTEKADGEGRDIPLDRFFLGPNQTALEPDEVIREITFAIPRETARMQYIKLGLRNAMAISVVSIAFVVETDGTVCRKSRVALGAVAPKPIRAYRVEAGLEGSRLETPVLEECSRILKEEISPISDIRASSGYREHAASILFKRAVREALGSERQER
jgi:carbon-monoxide dehydrogenase medium subunit